MIKIITGKPGTGKTYELVRIAYKAMKQGKNIYSNFHIDFSNYTFKNTNGKIYFWNKISDLVNLKNGEILIDECQIYMNSRNWKNLDERFQYKLQQHRKQGLNIWGAVQNVKRIDTVARELVNSVFVMRKIGKMFLINEYDIEDIEKVKKKSYSFKMFFLNKKLANSYNTMQEISYNLPVQQNSFHK